jgi:hypothetical protein
LAAPPLEVDVKIQLLDGRIEIDPCAFPMGLQAEGKREEFDGLHGHSQAPVRCDT